MVVEVYLLIVFAVGGSLMVSVWWWGGFGMDLYQWVVGGEWGERVYGLDSGDEGGKE